VVPGLSGTSAGTVWLDKATSRLVKAQLDVPTTSGQQNAPTAPVTVTLSDFDAPVTITPPS
jgi:lipoprotein LprG